MSIGRSHSRARASGFTLIEVMVAVALTTLLLWGLLQVFREASRFSRAVQADSDLCAGGRAALERMVREIATTTCQHTGYLKITESGDFDTIQFIAPVDQAGTKLAHLSYDTSVVDGKHILRRGINDTASLTVPAACNTAPFGVEVEAINIRWMSRSGTIHASSTNVTPSTTGGPCAVLIELRLRDPKGLGSITLSSAAYLPGAGI